MSILVEGLHEVRVDTSVMLGEKGKQSDVPLFIPQGECAQDANSVPQKAFDSAIDDYQ